MKNNLSSDIYHTNIWHNNHKQQNSKTVTNDSKRRLNLSVNQTSTLAFHLENQEENLV